MKNKNKSMDNNYRGRVLSFLIALYSYGNRILSFLIGLYSIIMGGFYGIILYGMILTGNYSHEPLLPSLLIPVIMIFIIPWLLIGGFILLFKPRTLTMVSLLLSQVVSEFLFIWSFGWLFLLWTLRLSAAGLILWLLWFYVEK